VLDVYMRTNMMYRTFTIVVVYGCPTRIVPTKFFSWYFRTCRCRHGDDVAAEEIIIECQNHQEKLFSLSYISEFVWRFVRFKPFLNGSWHSSRICTRVRVG